MEGFIGTWDFELNFSDVAEVSSWADEAMHWMVVNGVINGKNGTNLDPKAQATRAEAAAMLQRFSEKIK